MASTAARLEVRHLSKSFGSARALDRVDLQFMAGTIHAITGENGAGKSTLLKLLAGVYMPDTGQILLDGQPLKLNSPGRARSAGISTVFQELTVIPGLSVAENIFLGQEPRRLGFLDRRSMRRAAFDVLARIGLVIDPDAPCASLPIAQQQLIDVAKGLSADASIYILDEPTAALGGEDAARLHTLLHNLRSCGKLVIYLSHRLHEILTLCDTISVLKDGRHVQTQPAVAWTETALIRQMVGRPVQELYPLRPHPGARDVVLDVRSIVTGAWNTAVSLQVKRGEIVALAGLAGQGQRDLVRALSGTTKHLQGVVRLHKRTGEMVQVEPRHNTAWRAARGIAFMPEDRKAEGLYLSLSIMDNLWLGRIQMHSLHKCIPPDAQALEKTRGDLGITASSLRQEMSGLSGGNQQKVMLGRWLLSSASVLLIEEPTRGVDIGARAHIYRLLRRFCAAGGAVLISSSDLPEVLGLSDRILVMRAGSIVADFAAADTNEESVMRHALASSVEASAT